MPFEAQIWLWLSTNYPSLIAVLVPSAVFIAAFLRLHAFLALVGNQTKDLAKLREKHKCLRDVVRAMIVNHCSKYPLETKDLIGLLEKEKDDDDPS